ncbi:Thioesterase/thiol ester dehydrase-isomerase [Hypoxylon sp. FL1284]|nr:Thioesterase/thiol ester dehydrase-isomerase [Hypoxylon sp. FL1284]
MTFNPLANPHSAPTDHNQSVEDPLAHFEAIPWCASLLADRSILSVVVPDRRPLPDGESSFVRRVMNTPTTVRACLTFMRAVGGGGKKERDLGDGETNKNDEPPLSRSAPLLWGGGRDNGEDPRNPFLLFNALADLGEDLTSYVGTMHGGLYGVLMDEVMGTAANFQTEHGAYTVSFTTRYRRAVSPPQVVLIRGRVVRKEGRKLHLRGTIEDKDGNIMAEAEGLWISMSRNVGRSQL